MVGQLGIYLCVLRERVYRVLGMVKSDANPHLGPESVGLELELGDDAEIAAAAVEGPEEVRVLGLAGGDDLARCGDDREGKETVPRAGELASDPADPTAMRA